MLTALSGSLIFLCLLWLRSHRTFDYWASPIAFGEENRLSIGVAHGNIMLAWGWPFIGPSKWGLPQSEPAFGSEQELPEDQRATASEKRELAIQQFSFKVDGSAQAINYPMVRVPLLALILPLGFVLAFLVWRMRNEIAVPAKARE